MSHGVALTTPQRAFSLLRQKLLPVWIGVAAKRLANAYSAGVLSSTPICNVHRWACSVPQCRAYRAVPTSGLPRWTSQCCRLQAIGLTVVISAFV